MTNSRDVPADELARRVRESNPAWESYPEDIKAQLGARPAAEWCGRPKSFRCEDDAYFATFEVEGPWAGRSVAIPVLLKDTLGVDLRNDSAECVRGEVTYCFKRATGRPPSWVELKYPHGEMRLMLDHDGNWASK